MSKKSKVQEPVFYAIAAEDINCGQIVAIDKNGRIVVARFGHCIAKSNDLFKKKKTKVLK